MQTHATVPKRSRAVRFQERTRIDHKGRIIYLFIIFVDQQHAPNDIQRRSSARVGCGSKRVEISGQWSLALAVRIKRCYMHLIK